MKRILFSEHANIRMTQRRQDGIEVEDVYAACNLAKEILFKGVPQKIRLKGFTSKAGYKFDIAVVDEHLPNGDRVLVIVTVIGLRFDKRPGMKFFGYALDPNIPYKKRRKIIRRLRKKERKYIAKPDSIPKYRKDVRYAERA